MLHDTKPILSFRHERVAHLDENPSEQLPTYDNLDQAILGVVTLLQKYSVLIKGVSTDPYATVQDDLARNLSRSVDNRQSLGFILARVS